MHPGGACLTLSMLQCDCCCCRPSSSLCCTSSCAAAAAACAAAAAAGGGAARSQPISAARSSAACAGATVVAGKRTWKRTCRAPRRPLGSPNAGMPCPRRTSSAPGVITPLPALQPLPALHPLPVSCSSVPGPLLRARVRSGTGPPASASGSGTGTMAYRSSARRRKTGWVAARNTNDTSDATPEASSSPQLQMVARGQDGCGLT